jgi:hypothetical protein
MHPVPDHRGELFDAIEQFLLLDCGSIFEPMSRRRKAFAHQRDRAFEILMVGVATLATFARRFHLTQLDYFSHEKFLRLMIIPSETLAGQRPA